MDLYVIRVLQGKHECAQVFSMVCHIIHKSLDRGLVEKFYLSLVLRVVLYTVYCFASHFLAACGKEFEKGLVPIILHYCGQYSEVGHSVFYEDIVNRCGRRLCSRNSFTELRVEVSYYYNVLISPFGFR